MLWLTINVQKIIGLLEHAVEDFVPRVIGSIALYIVGTFLIRWTYRIFKRILAEKDFDPSMESFFLSFIKFGLRIVLFIGIIGILGVQTTSMAAMLAGIGVAIGSAFNGSLGNFAGGIMLIIYQPLRIGEFIEFNNVSGQVKAIGILNTAILTGDLKTIFLPNGMLSTGIIINWSRNGIIRVDIPISIEAGIDIQTAKTIALKALASHPLILKDPPPEIYTQTIQAGAIQLVVRPYCLQPDYWKVFNDTHSLLLQAFKEQNISHGIPKQILITKEA